MNILQNLETNCKDNKEFLFFIYREMAHIYHNFGEKKEELRICHKLIYLAEEINNNKKLGSAYCNMGNCLRDREMDRAFDYFKSSVELLEGSDLLGSVYGSMYWIQQKKRKNILRQKNI